MRIEKIVVKAWQGWRERRQLREYYLSQRTEGVRGQGLNLLVLNMVTLIIVAWNAATLRQALYYAVLVTVICVVLRRGQTKRLDVRLAKECGQRISEKEYKKRLNRANTKEVLLALRDYISQNYPVQELCLKSHRLQGQYLEEQLAVFYRYASEEEGLSMREVIAILRECQRDRIGRVRIFTGGACTIKSHSLAERYNLDLLIFDGRRTQQFLETSHLWPSPSEVQDMIKKESLIRRRRLNVIKRQAIERGNVRGYLTYGLLLLGLAGTGWGGLFLNLVFGVFLLVLAVVAFIVRLRIKDTRSVF